MIPARTTRSAPDPYNSKIKDKGCGLKVTGAPTGTFTNVVTDITDSRTP